MRWESSVDFEQRRIDARATLSFAAPTPAGPIDLDTRDLVIHNVRSGATDLSYDQEHEEPILGTRLRIAVPGGTTEITIDYETGPGASALQWLEPEQTADGTDPFLFTQCQAIHARSVVPLQDTPTARLRFDAHVSVPTRLRALMAAGFESRKENGERSIEHWSMAQPVPPYLFAMAVGRLDGRDLGPRTRVWAEPSRLEEAAWEFAEVERLLEAGERLFGPYDWERFDFLVMPPSFPYGGMENPRLTFLTPTLIAGDRSQVAVLAHELAHSWTGNLITNASAEHFWLNEGWTRYAEQRIVEAVYGEELSDLQIAVGTRGLEKTIQRFEREGRQELTQLQTNLAGVDPDDAFSDVPYEKGLLFLRGLERIVGRARFNDFVREYIRTYRFQAITTGEFLAFARRHLPEALDAMNADAWIHEPGLPGNAPRAKSERIDRIDALGAARPTAELAASFAPIEWQLWLDSLGAVDKDWCAATDAAFHLTESPNPEILSAWLSVAVACDYQPAQDRAAAFLGETGRMKFLKPLYTAFVSSTDGKTRARAIFDGYRSSYHPIAQAVLTNLLETKT